MIRNRARAWATWCSMLIALTLLMLSLRGRLDKAHVALAYLLLVLVGSAGGGRVLGLTLAGIAFVAFNVLFLPPYATLAVTNPLDWLVLIAFLVTSVVATQLLYRANSAAATARQRAAEVDRLATLGAETLNAANAHDALQAMAIVIRESIGADVCEVYWRSGSGAPLRVAHAERPGISPAPVVSSTTEGLLTWLVDRGEHAIELAGGTTRLAPMREASAAGRLRDDGADATPVRARLLPLVVRDHTVGVLRIASASMLALSAEQLRLLEALSYYAALGVERLRLTENAERAEAERRVETLRSALLTSVSHDLRTPLTAIKGLAHEIATGSDDARAYEIEREVDRLDTQIGDLLELSRIQAHAVVPVLAVNTVDELVGAALQRATSILHGREVQVTVPRDELLTGRFDLALTLRVLVNILENAAKYAPPDRPIELSGERRGDHLIVAIADRGPGVPEAEGERIFEPFYRVAGATSAIRGSGLGLSIARGLMQAQHGSVRYSPRQGGGAVFTIELPAADGPVIIGH